MGSEESHNERELALSRVSLLGDHEARLRGHLEHDPNGHERAAICFFRRLAGDVEGLAVSDRLVCVDIQLFEDAWVASSSKDHVEFRLSYLREAFRRCEEEELVFGFVHGHPAGAHWFSGQDDANEQILLHALRNRNGPDAAMIALMLCEGRWYGRERNAVDPLSVRPLRHILVLNNQLQVHDYAQNSSCVEEDVWARQAAAFGRPFVDKIGSLRIGVVGCSGTGSPTFSLLARSGVGELVLVDADKVAKSNLNRMQGAGSADIGRNKAVVGRDTINAMKLATKVAVFETVIDTNSGAVDALASCDVIFGCTDDHLGRQALNAAVYHYGLALIDMGLGGLVREVGGVPQLSYHFGRITTVLPEWGECLYCRKVIDAKAAARQEMLRKNPEITDDELRERYLDGGQEGAPGVGPFTAATADFAVATLYDLLTGFRRPAESLRRQHFEVDFVRMEIRTREAPPDAGCPYCGTREIRVGKSLYRLGRPNLGKVNSHV